MVAGCFRGSPFHVFITHLAHLFPLILSVTLLFSFHFVSTLSITPFSLSLAVLLCSSSLLPSSPSRSLLSSFPHLHLSPSLSLSLCSLPMWARFCQNLLCVCVCLCVFMRVCLNKCVSMPFCFTCASVYLCLFCLLCMCSLILVIFAFVLCKYVSVHLFSGLVCLLVLIICTSVGECTYL